MAEPGRDLLPLVRSKVREHLSRSAAFMQLPVETRRQIAHDTVQTFRYILGGADGTSRPESVMLAGNSPVAESLAGSQQQRPPEGETAGQRFAEGGGAVAAQQGGEALADLVQRVDFPAFVGGLIDGVFNAIVNASIKQMEAYADLVKNVAKSVDQYMKDNVTENNARDYLIDRYPDALELDIEGDAPKVKVRRGADEANAPDYSDDLGMPEKLDSVDDDTVEEKLVPAARRRIAMDRQQMLATMVMMGVNRLVVTNGSIEASCLFELNTTDAVKRRYARKTTSDWHDKQTSASGAWGSSSASSSGFLGLGTKRRRNNAWYAHNTDESSANFSVTTNRSEDSEAKVQMHARLAGKVNVQFKSDYFPMERMIDALQVNQVRAKTPEGATPATPPAPGAAPRGQQSQARAP